MLALRCRHSASHGFGGLSRPRSGLHSWRLNLAVAVFVTAMVLGQAVAHAANPACPLAASSTANSCTYAGTGAEQTYTVPAGVSFVTISAIGSHGGFGNNFVQGGKGAAVTATVPVPIGTTTLYVEVGTPGGNDNLNGFGGFNGGGFSGDAGGGGGASDVRTCSSTTCTDLGVNDTRLVVAGGGGGGGSGAPGCGNRGGQGGDSSVTGPGGGGAGDTCTSAAAGGNGGLGGTGSANGGGGGFLGGGGGGGYVGGEGGHMGPGPTFRDGGGGGAGSSFWIASAINPSMREDTTGVSQVVITAASATSTSLFSSSNPSTVGEQVTYRATVSPGPDGGTVAFKDGSTTISGCDAQPVDTSTGVATCHVTYSSPGSHTITAAYSGDAAFVTSTSAPIDQKVVAGAPSAQISSPGDHQAFAVAQHVTTSFSCSEGAGGPGLASCTDSDGASAPSGTLNTSTAGTFMYTVTATSSDGQHTSTSITYTVQAPPAIAIIAPAGGAKYTLGQVVHASYSCREGASGPGLAACAGPVSSGAAINTATVGSHTFTVTARSKDGQSVSKTVSYSVLRSARVRVAVVHASPLRRGCAVETGHDEREITAVSADATCRHLRLTLQGTIRSAGKLVSSAGGTARIGYTVMLPRGPATGGAHARVAHGRWQLTLILPAVNLDPMPPRYQITVSYSGDRTTRPARTQTHIRLESERAGL
jgi:Bacterial Ig-like domain (group 3)/Glycine rich protein